MRNEVAELVYPVIKYGLDVKDQLDSGERVDREKTRLDLVRLLADKRWGRLDGDSVTAGASVVFATSQSRGGQEAKRLSGFLGIRYALACWLDELFISHSAWGLDWRDHALELKLYNSAEAAWEFWEQAKRAEGQPGGDALEVYYLCVLLGFRGDYRDLPADLQAWIERVRPQVIRGYGEEPAQTDKSEPENFVPLLTGRDRFGVMFRWWGGTLFILLFVLVVFLVLAFKS